jgi:hypothetical protein
VILNFSAETSVPEKVFRRGIFNKMERPQLQPFGRGIIWKEDSCFKVLGKFLNNSLTWFP